MMHRYLTFVQQYKLQLYLVQKINHNGEGKEGELRLVFISLFTALKVGSIQYVKIYICNNITFCNL